MPKIKLYFVVKVSYAKDDKGEYQFVSGPYGNWEEANLNLVVYAKGHCSFKSYPVIAEKEVDLDKIL
jgi:hypothetical protein